MESLFAWLIEPLSLPFMQRALVGAVGVAVLCAVVGTFVVLLGLAFIGEGVSHGSLVVVVLLLQKELVLLAFDPEMARVMGVPTRAIYYLLLGLIGLTVIVCLRTLGVILVTALLVIPASAGRQLANRVPTMMLTAVIVSVLSAFGGLLLSYHLSISSGASIVLCSSVCFALSLGLGRRRVRLLPHRG